MAATTRRPPAGTTTPGAVPAAVAGERPATSAGATRAARALVAARFTSLLYLFVIVFLVLAAIIPAVVSGWQPLSVISGSMSPAVTPGSVVMVQPSEPDNFYAHPTIVAFDDPSRPDKVLTHRVVATESSDGVVTYTTKGDANRVADSATVAHDDTIGAVRMVVPFVGLPAAWVHAGQWHLLALWLAASMAAVAALLVKARP